MTGSVIATWRAPWKWLIRVLAIIGLFSAAGIFVVPIWLRHERISQIAELRQKAPWPKVYRDCLTSGSYPISNAQHLANASVAWRKKLEDSSIAYQKEFVGHSTNLNLSDVLRFTTPQTPAEQQATDLSPFEYDTHISANAAARLGLRSYVIVKVATPGGAETEHSFRYDACGIKF